MQNWSLDNHPVLNKFRSLLKTINAKPDCYYYLFLTPPYAYPTEKDFDPLMYLFFSTKDSPSILHQYSSDTKLALKLEGNKIKSFQRFNSKFEINLLLSTPCTCGLNECPHEFSYMLEEMDDDLYRHFDPPPLMKKIQDSYKDSKLSKQLLSEIQDEKLSAKLDEIERVFFTAEINASNRSQFVNIMSNFISEVAQIVFNIPMIKCLPVATKKELNFLVFNAISGERHYQLLSAYNTAFAKENFTAQENTRNNYDNQLSEGNTKLKKEEMEEAVKHLRNVLHLPSPAEMIDCITKFFDLVVAALPGVEVAADDILPAICFAMTKDVGFGSHVVSFFNYLTDIWPAVGLDEKVTYILITCSIAASHLSTKHDTPPPSPNSSNIASPTDAVPNSNRPPVVDHKQTEETINLIEDLLNFM